MSLCGAWCGGEGHSQNFTGAFLFSLCVGAHDAQATVSSIDVPYQAYENPVAEFTRSMSRLDHVSQMCSDIESADYEAYTLLIQTYVKLIYDGPAPYWVLSDVKERITDHTLCKWLVSESLIHYQFAYAEFIDVAHPKLRPPVLTENMSAAGRLNATVPTLNVARPSKH